MNEVTVVEVEPQMVLGTRNRGKYDQIPGMIGMICGFAVEKGMQFQGPPVFVCHESGAEEVMKADSQGTADISIVVPVSGKTEDTPDIKFYELPGGTMAKIIHKGPYEECTPTYEKLYAWLPQNGKTIAGPTREIYLNDPKEVPPEEILTEIYAPIE